MERLALRDGATNPDIVGIAAERLAEMAGFRVPAGTTVLLAACAGVGAQWPLSFEKLAPILAWYTADGHEAACRLCISILDLGGRGHTLGLHCTDEAVIRAFALEKPVNRIVLNAPTSLGAVGAATNLFPSMTLGCGSFGGNITSDNIGPQHLLNIKRLARANAAWLQGGLNGEYPELTVAADAVAPAAWPRREGADAQERPPLLGDPARRMPGEHFSDAELRRMLQASRVGSGTNRGGGLSHGGER